VRKLADIMNSLPVRAKLVQSTIFATCYRFT
jgi:hypothetical protein